MNPKLKFLWYSLYEPLRLKWERGNHPNYWYWSPIHDNTYFKPYKVSIYCPTFNRSDILLERALPSVCNQTYRNFEFIIVDDCSTDNTQEKVAAWCLKHNEQRVRVIRTKSRKKRYPPTRDNHWFAGPVVPANLGLKECKGSFIARIDDDDVWTPDHLEKLLGFAIKENAEFVSSGYNISRSSPVGGYFELGDGRKIGDFEQKTEYHGIEGEEWHGGTSSFFYRSYLKFFRYNIDCWRKKWNQVNDLDLCERMRDAGVRMSFLDEPTFTITPRPGETEIGAKAYRLGETIEEKYKWKKQPSLALKPDISQLAKVETLNCM
jgi:glycosyltransferase involved in cell wall biosynthesis